MKYGNIQVPNVKVQSSYLRFFTVVYKFEIQIYQVFYIAIYRFENINVFGTVYSSLTYLCFTVNTSSANLKILHISTMANI